MPRNGSGTMSVTNTFSAGQTATAASVNANFTDFASEVTNSLALDGQSTMTAAFKAFDGTAAAPGIVFGSDTDTGLFRNAADDIHMAIGGTDHGRVISFAAGTACLFVQTAAPTGWTKSTSHNDKALRVVTGTASSGGTTAFTSVFTSRTIAEANLPAHTHTFTTDSDGEHDHTIGYGLNGRSDGGDSTTDVRVTTAGTQTTSSSGAHTHTGTTDSTGSGTAMDFAVQYVDVIIASLDA